MAGVVNFILKREFEGINLNAQAGLSSKGDRGTYRTSGTFGKNFADGRGNVALSLEYNRANMVTYTDRPGLTGAFAGRRDRKSVVEGKSVSVRVDLGGRRIIKKNKSTTSTQESTVTTT